MQKKHLIQLNTTSWQKALRNLGIKGMYINIIKAIYDKPITNIIPKGKN
jgi:hypothetical protein